MKKQTQKMPTDDDEKHGQVNLNQLILSKYIKGPAGEMKLRRKVLEKGQNIEENISASSEKSKTYEHQHGPESTCKIF